MAFKTQNMIVNGVQTIKDGVQLVSNVDITISPADDTVKDLTPSVKVSNSAYFLDMLKK